MKVISNLKIPFVTCNKWHHDHIHHVTYALLNSIFMKKVQIRFSHYHIIVISCKVSLRTFRLKKYYLV
jgi:hypothetical protein